MYDNQGHALTIFILPPIGNRVCNRLLSALSPEEGPIFSTLIK